MSSVVRANGTDLATTFVNAGQLSAQIPASMLVSSGLIGVTVINGGATSDFKVFSVLSLTLPTVSGVVPWGLAPGTTTSGFLVGSNLLGASTASTTGTGVSVSVGSGGTTKNVRVTITVAPSAPLGERKVFVTTPAGTGGPTATPSNFVVAYGGSWSLTQPIQKERNGMSAIRLPDGKVLLAGGSGNTAEVFDPNLGTWTLTNPMAGSRSSQTATLLPNGRVLVAAGLDITHQPSTTVSTSEIYDYTNSSWTSTGSLNQARYAHTATLLNDGRVLVAGGFSNTSLTALNSAEIYDPATSSWTPTGNLNVARSIHTATLLPNGKVLVSGGSIGSSTYLSSCEIFDPVTGVWTTAGSLNTARTYHDALLLPTGQVLIAGGDGPNSFSSEIYNPVMDSWSFAGSMAYGHTYAKMNLLPDGKVLLIAASGSSFSIVNAERWDPATQLWSLVPPSFVSHILHSATMLADGRILVAGGSDQGGIGGRVSEVFIPFVQKRRGQVVSSN